MEDDLFKDLYSPEDVAESCQRLISALKGHKDPQVLDALEFVIGALDYLFGENNGRFKDNCDISELD